MYFSIPSWERVRKSPNPSRSLRYKLSTSTGQRYTYRVNADSVSPSFLLVEAEIRREKATRRLVQVVPFADHNTHFVGKILQPALQTTGQVGLRRSGGGNRYAGIPLVP